MIDIWTSLPQIPEDFILISTWLIPASAPQLPADRRSNFLVNKLQHRFHKSLINNTINFHPCRTAPGALRFSVSLYCYAGSARYRQHRHHDDDAAHHLLEKGVIPSSTRPLPISVITNTPSNVQTGNRDHRKAPYRQPRPRRCVKLQTVCGTCVTGPEARRQQMPVTAANNPERVKIRMRTRER